MTGRGLIAVANGKLLQLSRGPIAFIIVAAFLLLVSSLPDVSAAPAVDRIRQTSSWLISAASALLFLSSLLLPVAGGAPRTRLLEGRLLGARAANLGHAVAGFLFLVFLAGLLGLISWGVIAVKFKNPDLAGEGGVVRSIAYKNPAPFVLRPGDPWTSGEIALGPQGGTVQIELVPKLRFSETPPASSPATVAGPPRLELSWREGARKRTRHVLLSGKQPIIETIELAGPAARNGPLVIDLGLLGRDVELLFDRGAVNVLGVRTTLFPVLVRSLLVAGCVATVIAAAAQWFSNFVGPLIAVSAALTLVIAALVVPAIVPGSDARSAWSALLPEDPVAALRRGHETGWAEVGRAFLASVAAMLLGAAASVHGPERTEP